MSHVLPCIGVYLGNAQSTQPLGQQKLSIGLLSSKHNYTRSNSLPSIRVVSIVPHNIANVFVLAKYPCLYVLPLYPVCFFLQICNAGHPVLSVVLSAQQIHLCLLSTLMSRGCVIPLYPMSFLTLLHSYLCYVSTFCVLCSLIYLIFYFSKCFVL